MGCRVSWLKQLTLLTFSVLWKVPLLHWATGLRLYKGKHYLKSRGRWQCVPSKRRGTLAQRSSTASHEAAVLWKHQNSHSNASGLYSGGARVMRGFHCFLQSVRGSSTTVPPSRPGQLPSTSFLIRHLLPSNHSALLFWASENIIIRNTINTSGDLCISRNSSLWVSSITSSFLDKMFPAINKSYQINTLVFVHSQFL